MDLASDPTNRRPAPDLVVHRERKPTTARRLPKRRLRCGCVARLCYAQGRGPLYERDEKDVEEEDGERFCYSGGLPRRGVAMRDDMASVVTERPRRGHGNPSKKTAGPRIRRYDPEADYDEPFKLPVSRGRQYGWNAKEFSDLINPLKRYLRSCIGRPWSKVHSELSQKLDRRSLCGAHIWDHVMWEIDTDCYIGPDRLAYSNNRRFCRGDAPVAGLYVDPRTGLIREQRRRITRA